MLGANVHDWHASFELLCTRKRYLAGDVIFMQGASVDKIGFVQTGRAKAVAYSESGDETWLAGFDPYMFFGQTFDDLGLGQPYEVKAVTDIAVDFLPLSQLPKLLSDNLHFSLAYIRDLSLQLEHMRIRATEALTLSSKGRVCAELVRLSVPIGVEPDKDIIRPNPVLVELAVRVSSTRETVSRTVSELLKKGIITREPGALIVHNRTALKAAIK